MIYMIIREREDRLRYDISRRRHIRCQNCFLAKFQVEAEANIGIQCAKIF